MKTLQKQKGITLLSLVITILILLILAGVTIGVAVGNNGLIERTKEAARKTRLSQVEEQIKMDIQEAYMETESTGESEVSIDKIQEIGKKYRRTR